MQVGSSLTAPSRACGSCCPCCSCKRRLRGVFAVSQYQSVSSVDSETVAGCGGHPTGEQPLLLAPAEGVEFPRVPSAGGGGEALQTVSVREALPTGIIGVLVAEKTCGVLYLISAGRMQMLRPTHM